MRKLLTILFSIVFFQSQAFGQLGFVSFPVLKFIYTKNTGAVIGNALNFTGINTSGNATSTSWYNANYGSNLLQSNTQRAKSISYDDREHSTLAYRGTKTILNAAGIETSNRKSFEDNIASRVFGLTIGATDKAEERQENLLYGMQNAGKEYSEIPEDIAEIGKKAAETAAEVYENKGKAWEAGTDKAIATHIGEGLVNASLDPEICKTATDTGMGSHLGSLLVYTSVNPGEAADKIGGAADGLLFETIRSGFNNDNLVYAIGQVWSGTLSDIGLLYSGGSLLQHKRTVTYTSKGMYGLSPGNIQIDKAFYNMARREILKGNNVRIIGHYPDYLRMAEALNVKPFFIPAQYWNQMDSINRNIANFKFVERGAKNNDVFLNLGYKFNPTSYGDGLRQEIDWLEKLNYKKSEDSIRYLKTK